MKGTFYQAELIVFNITDEVVLQKYNELKASGELEAYVNKVFAESISRSLEKKQMESLDMIKDASNQQFDELSKKLESLGEMLVQKLDSVSTRRNPSAYVPPKEIVSTPNVTQDNNSQTIPSGETQQKENVNAGSLIKKGVKKKNLNMAALMGKASKMKN